MKKLLTIAFAAASVALLASCASLGGGSKEKAPPASVVTALKEAKTIAVLGYNTSKGLDDRLLDDAIKSSLFDISLEISIQNDLKFPIGKRVDTLDADFLKKLGDAKLYNVVPKSKVTGSAAYKKIKGDPAMDINNVNAAKGYTLTYQFDNFMDEAKSGSSIPTSGQVVNGYKDTLEEIGADLGIIVVQKPFMIDHTYALIPDQLINKKQPYFATGTRTYYYIVRPALGNQVIYTKVIQNESDTKYIIKGYTPAQRKVDEVDFLDQYGPVAELNHDKFIAWLADITK